jgi:hypothetical protein
MKAFSHATLFAPVRGGRAGRGLDRSSSMGFRRDDCSHSLVLVHVFNLDAPWFAHWQDAGCEREPGPPLQPACHWEVDEAQVRELLWQW